MKQLAPEDVLSLDDYLRVREQMRTAVRAERAVRRVAVGERISLSFENRQTVLFQIQEMVRVEEIRDLSAIVEEVRVYNDLIAGEDELRATFFVEITERARIRDDLDSLVGLESGGLAMHVDDTRIDAEFEPGHAREDRISAVHYVRFPLGRGASQALRRGGAAVSIVVDHPNYSATAILGAQTLSALAADLGAAVAPR